MSLFLVKHVAEGRGGRAQGTKCLGFFNVNSHSYITASSMKDVKQS